MPIDLQFNNEKCIVNSKCTGTIHYSCIEKHFHALLETGLPQGYVEAVDASELVDVALTIKDCKSISQVIKEVHEKKHCKGVVIYGPNNMAFKILKLLGTLVMSQADFQVVFTIEKNEFIEKADWLCQKVVGLEGRDSA